MVKCFFSATVGIIPNTGIHKTVHISGIESFDVKKNLPEQVEVIFYANDKRESKVTSINVTAFNPLPEYCQW